MPRIAVGGFIHETNTFSPLATTLADFERPDAWPGLVRGGELPGAVGAANIPVAGFLREAHVLGLEIAPLLWCAAPPSGAVESTAFEAVAGEMLERLAAAMPVEAVYLDLHGAMVTEDMGDAEGELLRRVRSLVGAGTAVVCSLDLHANTSDAMAGGADALLGYRTYPHVDMAETGARCARLLASTLDAGARLRAARRRLPFLIPLNWQCTDDEPMRSLAGAAMELEGAGVESVSLLAGFPLADVPDCGPSVLAAGTDPAAVERAADWLAEEVQAREGEFGGEMPGPDEAMARIRDLLDAGGAGPVVVADTQDNPGGGGSGDTVGLLRAALDANLEGCVLGLVRDPEAARAAHRAGTGVDLDLHVGAGNRVGGEQPVPGPWRVVALGDGRFEGTGPFYGGCRMDLGPMALLQRGGVRVAVSSRKQQAADQAMFRHLGVDPADARVLVVKSSVHFRADFQDIARGVVVARSPGLVPADPARLRYRHLPAGVRRRPGLAVPRPGPR